MVWHYGRNYSEILEKYKRNTLHFLCFNWITVQRQPFYGGGTGMEQELLNDAYCNSRLSQSSWLLHCMHMREQGVIWLRQVSIYISSNLYRLALPLRAPETLSSLQVNQGFPYLSAHCSICPKDDTITVAQSHHAKYYHLVYWPWNWPWK